MPAGSGDRGRNTVTDNRETIGDSAVAKAASTRPSCFNHSGRWTRGRTAERVIGKAKLWS